MGSKNNMMILNLVNDKKTGKARGKIVVRSETIAKNNDDIY